VDDGIPRLLVSDLPAPAGDVAARVKDFYERTPFPSYDGVESIRSLIDQARRGRYARWLDESIAYNSWVLDVGCGTGQLANFLGISCRQVVGTDLSLRSLRLGERFRREQGLTRVRFLQSSLFRPPFAPATFDVVLCNGVLHHTHDPTAGLACLAALARPGGHVVVGLYHRYGRWLTDARRLLYRATDGRGQMLDTTGRGLCDDRRRAWFADQYRHPHESKHTFGEVLAWFEHHGLSFVRALPPLRLADDPLAGISLFEPQSRGTPLERFLADLASGVSGTQEGGYFVMIGRKR
jgi:SAM-dependent methyltransferase